MLLLVLAVGALGIVGDGGPPDRIYATVLAVGLVGSVLARLRPRGMALTLAMMAGAQALVTIVAVGLVLAGVGDFETASVVDLILVNAMYVALFGVSAWLFGRSAADAAGQPVTGVRGTR